MKQISRLAAPLFLLAAALFAFQISGTETMAQSTYYTARGCVDCHLSTPTTCAGCHHHSGTLAATANKTSYAPGETVTITMTSTGARSGWIGARLYNQSGVEIARSTGAESGMGSSTLLPATLSAPAPVAAGSYTWKIAYYGNLDGTGTGDVHGEKSVNVAITVAAPVDATAPVVSTFTMPTTSTTLAVPVTALTATDNVAVTGYLITTSATKPLASAAGWSATAPASVTAPAAGSVTFYAWAKDAAGNVSASRSASVTITLPDTTAPIVNSFTLPISSTSLTVPVTALSASDNVGVTGYMVTTSITAPPASSSGWSASAPASVTAAAPGTVTFYAWAKDAAGNVSASRSATVTITLPDTTAPVVSTFTLPATATNLTVVVSSLIASDNVGVTGYMVTTSAAKPLASASGWTATAPASVAAPTTGTITFYAWAKDAAGNVSASRSATVIITLPDTTAPVVGAFTLPATSTSLTVPVTALTATDNVAVTGYMVTTSATKPLASAAGWTATAPANVTAASPGSVTFYAWAKDAAGNVSASRSASVVITTTTADTTKPVLIVSTLANGSYTNKPTLNVTGTATDEGGLDTVTVNGQAVIVGTDGSFSTAINLVNGANTVTVIATDKAGNQQTDSRTVTYDATVPVLTVTEPADNSTSVHSFLTVSGTVDETSTVSVKVNDGSAQSASISGSSFSATVNLVSGVNTIEIVATDLAGNSTSAKRTVTYEGGAFTLAVTYPNRDITTRKSSLVLTGKIGDATSSVRVTVNMDGRNFTPRFHEGTFRQRLEFTSSKLYRITVTATDEAGNSSSVIRNVIYKGSARGDDERDGRREDDDD